MTGPRLLDMRGELPEGGALSAVMGHLQAGGLVAMPTETVYGFGALLREEPIREIQGLKGRDDRRPFLVLIPGPESVEELEWPPPARELVRSFWPGALTLILADPGKRFPRGVRSPQGTVAVRQSPHSLAMALVEGLGQPLISTSVNPPGGSPALTAREAMETALALGGRENLWVLDTGRLPSSPPSTIVDCSGAEPMVIRAGSIPLNRLRCVLPHLEGPDGQEHHV